MVRRLTIAAAACAALAIAPCSVHGQTVVPFTQEAQARGLNYIIQGMPNVYGIYGYGCGFADLDNDGDQDVVIMGAVHATLGRYVGVFENDGNGFFTNRSINNGIPQAQQGSGLAMADYDGDGKVDIYLTQWGVPNILVRNLGNFQFNNVSAQANVANDGHGKGAHWGDYNNDGWLDLYVCNYTNYAYSQGFPERRNVLYRNLGNGTFLDVSAAQTVNDPGYSFQAVWFDMERDGDLDLYLCNDRGHLIINPNTTNHPNQLWRNDNGQMVNISDGCGADWGLFAMGLAAGDLDANGYPDLYVTNLAGYAQGFNPLFMNVGNGTFTEFSQGAGVDHWTSSWGCIFWDFDNNGLLDLYVNNQIAANTLYANYGSFPLVNVTAQAAVQGTHGSVQLQSYVSAVADVNNDGALDLLLNNMGGNVQLFINHTGQLNNYVRYKLVGVGNNKHAVGANVDTRVGTAWQFREIYSPGNNYTGQNELPIHIGLGQAKQVDEAVVKWPGGAITRTLTNLPANQTWTIYPPALLGHANADGVVNHADFLAFANCFDATLSPGCEMMDFDGDSFIDLDDFASFLNVYAGIIEDCNQNGTTDLQEILLNPALDADSNGQLDNCGPPKGCNGDVNASGSVNVDDLLMVINNWGNSGPPGPGNVEGDANSDGTVNVDDLLMVISNWGPCA